MYVKSIIEDYVYTSLNKLREIETGELDKEKYKQNIKKYILGDLNEYIDELGILERNKEYIMLIKNKLDSSGIAYREYKFETQHRLSIDTSGEFGWLIDEVGLAWDPIMDTPYIPSSSIKGLFRATLTWKILEHLLGDDKNAESIRKDAVQKADIILGGGGSNGFISNLAFFDAYPIDKKDNLIGLDVLTPMYSITKGTIGEHEANPTPIFIPVVEKGVTFHFIIASISRKNSEIFETKLGEINEEFSTANKELGDMKLGDLVGETIKEMLEVWGIGGKTSYNYGILREVI